MGKHRSPEERLGQARHKAERYAKAMDKHDKRAHRFTAKGEHESAAKENQHCERTARLQKQWEREVRRIEKQIKVRDALTNRAPKPREEVVITLSPAEQQRLDREEKAHQGRVDKKRKQLSAASVGSDPRTAVGSRSYDVVNMGAKFRATINHFNNCIRRPADRTDTRRLAWETFDRHYENVSAGLISPPRFEPGVDTSAIPAVADARLQALSDDADLRVYLGTFFHALLIEVVYKHHALGDLPGLSPYQPRERVVFLLHGLDLAAIFWRLDQVKRTRGYKFSNSINSALGLPPVD